MMQQTLWHDTAEDALRAIVEATGGPKRVAAELWPGKGISDAHRRLLHCLDAEREQKFSLDEIVWLLRRGREAGCHTGITYLARACGYEDPKPIEPEDERAALQRKFVQAVKAQADLIKRLESLA